MELIKNWALSIAVAGICGGIVHMLAPNGGVTRMLKVVVSLFFVCVLFSPLMDLDTQAFDEGVDLGEVQQQANNEQAELLKGMIEQTLEKTVEDIIVKMGITPRQVVIQITVESIKLKTIDSVMVEINTEDSHRESDIRLEVEKELGVEPTVSVV